MTTVVLRWQTNYKVRDGPMNDDSGQNSRCSNYTHEMWRHRQNQPTARATQEGKSGGMEGGSNYTSEIPIHVTHRFQTYRIITSALGNMSVWYIEKYHWIYEKKIDIQSLYYFFTIPFQTISQKGTAEILQRSIFLASPSVTQAKGCCPAVQRRRCAR